MFCLLCGPMERIIAHPCSTAIVYIHARSCESSGDKHDLGCQIFRFIGSFMILEVSSTVGLCLVARQKAMCAYLKTCFNSHLIQTHTHDIIFSERRFITECTGVGSGGARGACAPPPTFLIGGAMVRLCPPPPPPPSSHF